MAAQFGSNSYPTEFNFIENPIIVHVASSYFEFPEDSTFRQIVIQVDVHSTWDGKDSTYNFYADASAGTDLSVDISSALRGAMKGWEPDADTLKISYDTAFDCNYPYATFSTTLSEKYMQEGEVFEIAGASRSGAYAYYGGLTNYELLTFDSHAADFASGMFFTRKPRSGELHAVGDISTSSVLNYGVVRTHGEPVTSADFEKGEMQQFLFVNSLGVLETVSALSRESLSYGIESETKNLESGPSYFAKPNRTTHKTGGRGALKMSSGTVNRAWADWWTTEFLMAKKYWMMYDSRWLPVTVTPADDETAVYDKAEQRLPHVDFDVEIAVEGSIMNRVRTT